MALVLLASLAAMGITLTAADGIAETAEFVVDKFESWVNSTGQSLSDVWSRIRYGITSSGQFAVNAFGADRIGVFARQLVLDYSLVDNSSVITGSPSGLISSAGTVVTWVPDAYYPTRQPVVKVNNLPSYFVVVRNPTIYDSSAWYGFYSFSDVSLDNALISCPVSSAIASDSFVLDGKTFYCSFMCVSPTYGGNSQSVYTFDSNIPFFENVSISGQVGSSNVLPSRNIEATRFILESIGLLGSSSSLAINTGVLDVPQVGDYDDSDGLLIDGIGSWGDTLQDIWDKISGWSIPNQPVPAITYEYALSDELAGDLVNEGELTTENSPLVLWPGNPFGDFSFGSIWHYVTEWVSSMSAGLALTGSIMFSLPFVGVFYAVLVLTIVLSLWRLLKHA